jgi:hypothetical protein
LFSSTTALFFHFIVNARSLHQHLRSMKQAVIASLVFVAATAALATPDIVIGDFEGADYGAWKAEGSAFGSVPMCSDSPRPPKLNGFIGKGLAVSLEEKDAATGALLSPEFKIERKFINLLVWGERNAPSIVGVELVIDGRVARACSATEMFDPTRTLR